MSNLEDDFDDEFEIVTMTDENGEDVEFAIISNTEYNKQRYLLVVTVEDLDADDDSAEALIIKESGMDENDIKYELVEDDDEFDKVSEIFANETDEYDLEI